MRTQFETPDADPVEHLIVWHDGDVKAAIKTLLDDIQDLRLQLALASCAISKGYTRGWLPDDDSKGAP
ncbi:dehydrogenase [Rhizobium sp.]|jgi:hypothetical protein|uniref:dehydrogenase n=1 Tax=Rhizobium sp. TaxID=391 RepID=UPI000E919535|nr:dehydrogenase [Rhizobium sp.]